MTTIVRLAPGYGHGPHRHGPENAKLTGYQPSGHAHVAAWRLILVSAVFAVQGCASVMSAATDRMAHNLTTAFKNQSDLDTVRSATPAYLLLLDALLEGDPDNASLHMTAARLHAAYAGAFVADPVRRREMERKAFALARRAWCLEFAKSCGIHEQPFENLSKVINAWPVEHIGRLYDFGVVWAGYIEQHSNDWNAVAQIPKVAMIMRRVTLLDETHDGGGAHLYLAVIESLVPPALGGHPENAREHFRRAIALSDGKNLMAPVLYAERYARMVFDRDLHDRLLNDVLNAPLGGSGFTLMNTIAKARARVLLVSADEYF